MHYQTITLERHGPIARLNLNRAEHGNAITHRMVGEIADACEAIEGDESLHVAVLAGFGRSFSVGWDPKELAVGIEAGQWRDPGGFEPLAGMTKPVVAVLHGEVCSGGLELALAADVRIASEDAQFAFPEVKWGIVPIAGGIQRLVRLVGRARALDMLLTGDPVLAVQALADGLVTRVVESDRVSEVSEALAVQIAGHGPIAVKYAKEAVVRGAEMPLEQALRYETDLTVILQTTADRAEGVEAFLKKRQPHFKGR